MTEPIALQATATPKRGRGRPKKSQGVSVPAAQLQPGLDTLIRMASALGAYLGTRSIPDEHKREALRDILPLKKGAESESISVPAAKLLEKSWINRLLGPVVAGSEDYILLVSGVYAYIERVSDDIKELVERESTLSSGGLGSSAAQHAA